jgi:DUF1365 family protein
VAGECRAESLDGSVTVEAVERQTETDADVMGAYAAERKSIMADKSLSKAQRKSKLAAAKVRRNIELAARKALRKALRKANKLRPKKKVKPRVPDLAA